MFLINKLIIINYKLIYGEEKKIFSFKKTETQPKGPTLFAQGREGALLPLVPLKHAGGNIRQVCQHWTLRTDTITCIRRRLTVTSGQNAGSPTPKTAWPPPLFNAPARIKVDTYT